jgi:hypothetical protein
MLTHDDVRSHALALPGVVERDHHGRPSFRVSGKIFATLWDEEHMNLMLDVDGILTAVQGHADACQQFLWGGRLRAVSVDLQRATPALVEELLADAWEGKAGKRLLAERAASGDG